MIKIKVLITGGCKNGKSSYAESFVSKFASKTYYVATMTPTDDEDVERILRHQKQRKDYGFITIEQPTDINKCIKKITRDSNILLDSTTALLSNEMFLPNNKINTNAHIKISEMLLELSCYVKNIVVVSDYIFSDANTYDELTEKYRYSLAYIDKVLAKQFDFVYEITMSNLIIHKGGLAI